MGGEGCVYYMMWAFEYELLEDIGRAWTEGWLAVQLSLQCKLHFTFSV